MAINRQTLAAANSYTDDALGAHAAADDPHPQYAEMVYPDGSATGGAIILLKPTDTALPPVRVGSLVVAPGPVPAKGVYMPNETATAWVALGLGPIPADHTPPSVPSNFRVTSKTTNSLTVVWDASTDAETGVGGYDVALDTGAWVSLGNVLTYTFSALAAGSAHTMKVRARDNATTPNLSNPATTADTTTAAAVAAPRNLRVTAPDTTTITFAWDAPTSGTVSRYEWRLGTAAFATNGTSATKQVTGLTADTPYTFGVRAVFADATVSAEVTTTARTTGGVVGSGSMYVGIHIGAPPVSAADVSNFPELAHYNGMSQLQVLQDLEAQMRTLTGFTENPLMSVGHIFQSGGSYTLKAWGTTQLNRMPAMVANFKPAGGSTTAAMQKTASGDEDALIQALIDSLPAGKRVYLTYFHEPDETAGSFATAWRAASAHWAKYIIDHRGVKDLHPMVCLTAYSFRPANAATQAQFLSVTDDYEALGIDWRTQVVMGPDGYEDKSSESNFDAAVTFAAVFPTLYARGWRRFGITETATATHTGAAASRTITAADVTGAVAWAKSVVKLNQTYKAQLGSDFNMEYTCWFNSTGSKGPVGSWMFTDAIKAVWGQAAHYKGPAPGW